MTGKNKIFAVLSAAVLAFLVGFVPQYLEVRRLRGDMTANNERMAAIDFDLRLAEVRDLSAMMLLETLQQNFGLARDHSTRYFEKLQEAINAAQPDSSRSAGLQELLARRDAITTSLAQSDPGSVSAIQDLCLRTHEVTRNIR